MFVSQQQIHMCTISSWISCQVKFIFRYRFYRSVAGKKVLWCRKSPTAVINWLLHWTQSSSCTAAAIMQCLNDPSLFGAVQCILRYNAAGVAWSMGQSNISRDHPSWVRSTTRKRIYSAENSARRGRHRPITAEPTGRRAVGRGPTGPDRPRAVSLSVVLARLATLTAATDARSAMLTPSRGHQLMQSILHYWCCCRCWRCEKYYVPEVISSVR